MFRALLCSLSGGQNCTIQLLVSSHSVGGRPVHRLREDSVLSQPVHRTVTYRVHSSLNLCTGRPPTEFIRLSTCAPDGHLQSSFLSQSVHRAATYRVHFSLNLCTGRPPTECDDTRCCIVQFDLLMMSTYCSKHVEVYNKLIRKREFVH